MGLLIDGVWHDRWYDTASTGGRFQRQESAFRNWITPDGAAGPSGAVTDTESAKSETGAMTQPSDSARPQTGQSQSSDDAGESDSPAANPIKR